MGLKKNAKLSIKRETLRRLDSMTDDQLRHAAGGSKVVYQDPILTKDPIFNTTFCAGIRTTGGGGGGSIITLDQTCRCTTTPP